MLLSPDVYGIVPGGDDHKAILLEPLIEASTMATLNHPHIVRFVGVVEEPLTAPTSLEGYLRRADDGSRRVLRLHEYTRLLEHVLEGLVYLHTLRPRPVLHLFLTPASVLVFENDDAPGGIVFKICDFDVSLGSLFLDSLGRLPVDGEVGVGGAAYYRAPEIGTPDVSTKSDVFSFALMASVVLLASVEVDGAGPEVADAALLLYGGLSGQQRVLEDAWSRAGLPPQLSMLLRRCGEVDPHDRLDSSEALGLLRAFLMDIYGRAAALERVSRYPVLLPSLQCCRMPYYSARPYAVRQTARESLEGSGGTTLVVLPSGDGGFASVGDWIIPMLATEGAIRHVRSVSAMQHCAGKHL